MRQAEAQLLLLLLLLLLRDLQLLMTASQWATLTGALPLSPPPPMSLSTARHGGPTAPPPCDWTLP